VTSKPSVVETKVAHRFGSKASLALGPDTNCANTFPGLSAYACLNLKDGVVY
jgi:hypothetical protein